MIIFRRYLTFIELMIVMAIIGSAAGLIGMNINKAMQQQRFNTEVSFVVEQLRLAQNLMLIVNEDATVELDKLSNNYFLHMKLQCPLKNGWDKELVKGRELRSIKEISFTSRLPDPAKTKSVLAFEFFSGGAVMTEGVLKLTSKEGMIQYICLSGRPAPIQASEKEPSCTSKLSYEDERVTNITKSEITHKMQINQNRKKREEENENKETIAEGMPNVQAQTLPPANKKGP